MSPFPSGAPAPVAIPFVARSDFESYEAARPGEGVQLLPNDAGRFEGWLRRHRGGGCWVKHGEARLPHLLRIGTTRRAVSTRRGRAIGGHAAFPGPSGRDPRAAA